VERRFSSQLETGAYRIVQGVNQCCATRLCGRCNCARLD
jgi:hypothetical protein